MSQQQLHKGKKLKVKIIKSKLNLKGYYRKMDSKAEDNNSSGGAANTPSDNDKRPRNVKRIVATKPDSRKINPVSNILPTNRMSQPSTSKDDRVELKQGHFFTYMDSTPAIEADNLLNNNERYDIGNLKSEPNLTGLLDRRANDTEGIGDADEGLPSCKKIRLQLNCANINTNSLTGTDTQETNEDYNANVYNPCTNLLKSAKRFVIIDAIDVGFGHALNKDFSVKGLQICIDAFVRRGHEVQAVMPRIFLQIFKPTSSESLIDMYKEGRIAFTPSKSLPGKFSTSNVDRFILQLANQFDAAVISNDNYIEAVKENPEFKKIVEYRVIGYTWCKDVFILPKDPYGSLGPTLDAILNY